MWTSRSTTRVLANLPKASMPITSGTTGRAWAASLSGRSGHDLDGSTFTIRSAKSSYETDAEYIISTLIARRERVVSHFLGGDSSELIVQNTSRREADSVQHASLKR